MLYDSLLPSLLAGTRELTLVVCTIGPHLEKKGEDYVIQGDLLRAVLLDSIGSTAVDALTQETCQLVRQETVSLGYQASSPLSPGERGFPLSKQRQLFQLVPTEQTGVRLTSIGMMVPHKTISLDPEMPT